MWPGLYSIFGDTVSSALDILDRNKLTVYEGETSQRRCGVVVGSSGLTHVLLTREAFKVENNME